MVQLDMAGVLRGWRQVLSFSQNLTRKGTEALSGRDLVSIWTIGLIWEGVLLRVWTAALGSSLRTNIQLSIVKLSLFASARRSS